MQHGYIRCYPASVCGGLATQAATLRQSAWATFESALLTAGEANP